MQQFESDIFEFYEYMYKALLFNIK